MRKILLPFWSFSFFYRNWVINWVLSFTSFFIIVWIHTTHLQHEDDKPMTFLALLKPKEDATKKICEWINVRNSREEEQNWMMMKNCWIMKLCVLCGNGWKDEWRTIKNWFITECINSTFLLEKGLFWGVDVFFSTVTIFTIGTEKFRWIMRCYWMLVWMSRFGGFSFYFEVFNFIEN